ncbi:MAG: PRC-barrel domain-containing protein [bacterium]
MRLTTKDLISLPVETKSGEKLGKIAALEIDCETQQIVCYYVKSSNPIKDLVFQDQLIISPVQVISITAEKMVVEDGVIKEKLKDALNVTTPINLE